MFSKTQLLSIMGALSIATIPASQARAEDNGMPTTSQEQSVKAPWYRTAWKYTGGAVGTGIVYLGKGLEAAGQGASWTLDKALYPVRKITEGTKYVTDKMGEGTDWIENKTGIPTATVGKVLTFPGKLITSVSSNTDKLITEAPRSALALGGSVVGTLGHVIEVNPDGITESSKDIADNTVDLAKTTVVNAGLAALDITAGQAGLGVASVATSVVRDGVAAGYRITDAVTGNADLSKPLPKDLAGISKYSYDRARYGREAADVVQGSFFVSAANAKDLIPPVPEEVAQKDEKISDSPSQSKTTTAQDLTLLQKKMQGNGLG